MGRIRLQDVERMEGPDPSTDRVCITHDKPIEVCTKCDAEFFRCCITYLMENRPGLCGSCGHRTYADELYRDAMDHDRDPVADDIAWADREAPDEPERFDPREPDWSDPDV